MADYGCRLLCQQPSDATDRGAVCPPTDAASPTTGTETCCVVGRAAWEADGDEADEAYVLHVFTHLPPHLTQLKGHKPLPATASILWK